MKTIAGQRKTRFRGAERVAWSFAIAAATYNLVRLRKLLEPDAGRPASRRQGPSNGAPDHGPCLPPPVTGRNRRQLAPDAQRQTFFSSRLGCLGMKGENQRTHLPLTKFEVSAMIGEVKKNDPRITHA